MPLPEVAGASVSLSSLIIPRMTSMLEAPRESTSFYTQARSTLSGAVRGYVPREVVPTLATMHNLTMYASAGMLLCLTHISTMSGLKSRVCHMYLPGNALYFIGLLRSGGERPSKMNGKGRPSTWKAFLVKNRFEEEMCPY